MRNNIDSLFRSLDLVLHVKYVNHVWYSFDFGWCIWLIYGHIHIHIFIATTEYFLWPPCLQTIESSDCGENSEGEAVDLSQLVNSTALVLGISVTFWLFLYVFICLIFIYYFIYICLYSFLFWKELAILVSIYSTVGENVLTFPYLLIHAEPHRSGRFWELEGWNNWC